MLPLTPSFGTCQLIKCINDKNGPTLVHDKQRTCLGMWARRASWLMELRLSWQMTLASHVSHIGARGLGLDYK